MRGSKVATKRKTTRGEARRHARSIAKRKSRQSTSGIGSNAGKLEAQRARREASEIVTQWRGADVMKVHRVPRENVVLDLLFRFNSMPGMPLSGTADDYDAEQGIDKLEAFVHYARAALADRDSARDWPSIALRIRQMNATLDGVHPMGAAHGAADRRHVAVSCVLAFVDWNVVDPLERDRIAQGSVKFKSACEKLGPRTARYIIEHVGEQLPVEAAMLAKNEDAVVDAVRAICDGDRKHAVLLLQNLLVADPKLRRADTPANRKSVWQTLQRWQQKRRRGAVKGPAGD